MIVSFGDRATEDLYHGYQTKRVRHFPTNIVRLALRKLDVLNGAAQLNDLRQPPGNRLKALKGNLKGFYGIRVNNQWRIIFRWSNNGPTEVSLTDYH